MGWYRFFKCLAGVQTPISLAPKAFDRAALSNGPMPSNPAYRAINSVTVSPSLPRSRLSSSWINFCAGWLGEITRLFYHLSSFNPRYQKCHPGLTFKSLPDGRRHRLDVVATCKWLEMGFEVCTMYSLFRLYLFTFSYSHVNNWRQSFHCRKCSYNLKLPSSF